MKFNPDRFLGDNPEPEPRASAFGYGRRICECACLVSSLPDERRNLSALNRPRAPPRTGVDVARLCHFTGGARYQETS